MISAAWCSQCTRKRFGMAPVHTPALPPPCPGPLRMREALLSESFPFLTWSPAHVEPHVEPGASGQSHHGGWSRGRREVWEATEGTLHCSSEEVSSGNMETKGLAARLNSSLDFSLETHTCPQLPAVLRGPRAGQCSEFPTYSSGIVQWH